MGLNWLLQLLIIFAFLIIGHGITSVFPIPLPGSVIGMILLFLSLLTGIMKINWIEKAASFQLKHLSLLFIPPTVSLFISSNVQEILRWNIFIILFVSSLCSLLGTAYFVEWYEKLKRSKKK